MALALGTRWRSCGATAAQKKYRGISGWRRLAQRGMAWHRIGIDAGVFASVCLKQWRGWLLSALSAINQRRKMKMKPSVAVMANHG